MTRKLTLRLSAFLLVTVLGSTANACYLVPILNPFNWFCGYNCGQCCGYGEPDYSAWHPMFHPFLSTRRPAYGYGYGYGNYNYTGGSSIYTPAWGGGSDCGCNSGGSYVPSTVPAPAAPVAPPASSSEDAAFYPSATSWTAPATAWSVPQTSGWMPHRRYTPRVSSTWQTAPVMGRTAWTPAPRTAMLPTAPVYGPATYSAAPAGDITGDHELPVVPNAWNAAAPVPVRAASYQTYPRIPRNYPQTARRYSRVVH